MESRYDHALYHPWLLTEHSYESARSVLVPKCSVCIWADLLKNVCARAPLLPGSRAGATHTTVPFFLAVSIVPSPASFPQASRASVDWRCLRFPRLVEPPWPHFRHRPLGLQRERCSFSAGCGSRSLRSWRRAQLVTKALRLACDATGLGRGGRKNYARYVET